MTSIAQISCCTVLAVPSDRNQRFILIIVVPNADLLDNHQVELADALAEQEYVGHGKLDDLPKALDDAEALRQRQREWPPTNSGAHRETMGLKGVLDQEMGFLD